jgi:hypothetical protein
MREGVLRKGFTIVTPKMRFSIPRGTRVFFHGSTPTITFEGYDIQLFKTDRWYANIYGTLFLVIYDPAKPPYPLSYFK